MRQLFIPCEDPRRFAACAYALNGAFDCSQNLRVFGIARMPERRCEISRPDEYAIDPSHAGDGFQVIEPETCFDLNQDANLTFADIGVVLDASEVRGSRSCGITAHASGRIVRVPRYAPAPRFRRTE